MDHPDRFQVSVRIRGELDPAWSTVFGDLSVVPRPDGTTVVAGELADQAAVHGLIAAIRDLGLCLVSLETVAIAPSAARPRNPAESFGSIGTRGRRP